MSAVLLEHVHIYCSDLSEMSSFWRHIVGAKELGPALYGGEEGVRLELAGGVRLALQKKAVTPADTIHYASGINHLGFTVENVAASLEHALKHPGVDLDKDIFETPFGMCAFIRGPENLRVEFVQPHCKGNS